jgi:GAF domain-containing protein
VVHDDTFDLVAAVTRLQSIMLGSARMTEFLAELVRLAPGLIPGPLSCSITLRGERDPYTVTSSDDLALAVDELQYAHRTGPCLEAIADATEIYVEVMRTETRWDGYPQHAADAGVGSSLSLPLTAGGDPVIGALNLYSPQTHGFGDVARQNLRIVAAQAAGALTVVMRQARQDEVSSQLERALSSRAVIDQAIGVIMARRRCTADEAFALLRTQSQRVNRKLRDLAAEVVRDASGREPAQGSGFTR